MANEQRKTIARVAERSGTDASRAGSRAKTQHNVERLWTPLFAFIVIFTLCSFMVGQGLNSGTSVYLNRLGFGTSFAGVLGAVFSASAAVARLAAGPLIDSRGRVAVMLVGGMLLFVGTVVPVFASGEVVLAVCRILQGIGFASATTASATAASDVLPASRLGEGIGYFGLGQALAMSIGPALALYLAGTDPAENLYVGMSAVALLAIAFGWLCRYEHNLDRLPESSTYRIMRERESSRAASAQGAAGASGNAAEQGAAHRESLLRRVFEPRALPGMLPMLVLSPAFGFGIFFMGLYGTELGFENAGLFYTLSAVSMVVIRLTSRAFMDRMAPIKIMAAGVACGLVGFAMVLFAGNNEALFCLAGLPYGICLGVSMPINQSVAVKNTPPERWGATNAAYLLASDIGIGCASAIWGMVNQAAGFQVTLVCCMCCVAASLAVAFVSYPRPHKCDR